MNNYYKILGLSKDASQEDIKKTYRKLSKKHHPDMGGDDEMFKKINEAYSVLGDEKKRKEHDNPRRGFDDIFSSGGFGSDFMESMFNQSRSRRYRGSDIKIDLTITVKDSMMGGEKEVSYYRMTKDFREERRSIKINIPQGADDGNLFRVSGGGNQGESSPGDLIIIINIGSDGVYSKSGFNLFYNLELNPLEILTGKEATIDLYHSKIKVNIPSCVDMNKQMRVKGKGFKTRRGFGDLFITFKVKTPKELTEYEWRLVEQLKKGDNFRD
jgi:curved DNA-binding protein